MGRIVVLHKEAYEVEMSRLLSDRKIYALLQNNPTYKKDLQANYRGYAEGIKTSDHVFTQDTKIIS